MQETVEITFDTCFLLSAVLSLFSANLGSFKQKSEENVQTKSDGLKEADRENGRQLTCRKKREMVRDGSMAFGETKGPHVIFHLFMSFLFSFFSLSFVMVLMWSAFMPAPKGHNRTEPLEPRQLYPFYPSIHHSPLSIPPSLSTPF